MKDQLFEELDAAEAWGLDRICLAAESHAGLPQGLLLAIASRESHCRDVVGNGGHGRGVFQIDDRRHATWLATQESWASGRLPPVDRAAAYLASLVAAAMTFGRGEGVLAADLPRFAAAAYDAGREQALAGYRTGDPDRSTTGGDYGADVVRRMRLVRDWLAHRGHVVTGVSAPLAPAVTGPGGKPIVHPGDHGPAVRELKLALKAWFLAHPPTPPFSLGALYGSAAVAAVKELQERNGIEPDGVVGPQTWAVFGGPDAPVADRALTHPSQVPPLPDMVQFPHDMYVRTAAWLGLQPWIVPQVEAIAAHFELEVAVGYGKSPPHVHRTDHAWGGAADLAGAHSQMIACTVWADALCADPWEPGAVFRWVAGPVRGTRAVKLGLGDHVHLSWYRTGPATTIFGTPEFR